MPRFRRPPADKLAVILESILFAASKPIAVTKLARALRVEVSVVEAALASLSEVCQERGVRVQRANGAVQMVTAPEAAPYVERLIGTRNRRRLPPAALETLAIIAYKQPMTRAQVETIRGVDCGRVIASLKSRDLITEVGRADEPRRPPLFGTTFKFLEHFGLERPEDLPLPSAPIKVGDKR